MKKTYCLDARREAKTWLVWGANLKKIEIEAVSVDDALRKAREIDRTYNSVQMKGLN